MHDCETARLNSMTVNMSSLPIEPLLAEICQTLLSKRRLVLGAPPGAGKTTRVPLALAGLLDGIAGLPDPDRHVGTKADRCPYGR